MPLRAPTAIVVVAKARESRIVRLFEPQLTAGGAIMAMQMAAVALGFSGIWRSGWPMFDHHVANGLGLGADDHIVGSPSRHHSGLPEALAVIQPGL